MSTLTDRMFQNAIAGLLDRNTELCEQVEADDEEVDILEKQIGSSYFKILGLPEEEFPSLARFEEDFHDPSKSSKGWVKEDFLCSLCRRNAICTERYSVFI